ncbi:SRPBCC family protein [Actinomycetes bacterium KLBMP 9797]
MSDILDELAAVHRAVRTDGADATVVLTRGYDAPVDDVWDAITSPERLSRWFLPVSGDLRLGGTYQLQGNAGGEILRCEPPQLLAVTWLFGENPLPSQVTVRLSSEADGATTTLELEHAATVDPKFWDEYGPGAVGVGWDLGLLGLALHLRGDSIGNPEEWESTPEGRAFATRSAESWGVAMAATGANPDDVARMVANTTAFYAPPPS